MTLYVSDGMGAGQARCLPGHNGPQCQPSADLLSAGQGSEAAPFAHFLSNGWVSSSMTKERKARQKASVCLGDLCLLAVEVGTLADTLTSCLIRSNYTSFLHFPLALSFS